MPAVWGFLFGFMFMVRAPVSRDFLPDQGLYKLIPASDTGE